MNAAIAVLAGDGIGPEVIGQAVAAVVAAGWRTADLAAPGEPAVGTRALGRLAIEQVEKA